MEIRWERLGRLVGPLTVALALTFFLHLELEWSLRWSIVAGLFAAVRLQKWALV